MEKLYSLKEAKRLLGVQTKAIQRWDREGMIRVIRTPGGRRRIPESEILRIQGEERKNEEHKIGWDLNKYTLDGFSPNLGWIRASLKKLFAIHIAYDNKRRRINRIASKRLHTGKELKKKYTNRERNKVSLIIHHLTNAISSLGYKHGFEDLNKTGMQKRRRRKWNRELGYTDWKKIVNFTGYKSIAELFDPYHTSKDCSRCGWVNKDLRGEKFECKNCGLIIDRQMNAR